MLPRTMKLLPALLAAAAFAAGCTDDAPAPPRDAAPPPDAAADVVLDGAPADVAADVAAPEDVAEDRPMLRPPPITRTETDAVLEVRRRGCMYGPGAWPAETLGRDVPVGDDIPIRHILVLMQENRSFDSYFAKLRENGQTDVDVPAAGWTNPRADGTPVPLTRDTTYCVSDTEHGWNGSHRQFHDGANDGFVTTNDPAGERAMAYQDPSDLPFTYDLANAFAIGDRYFCSLLGPTWPNRLYQMAATSFGLTHNIPVLLDTRNSPVDSIYHRLDEAGLDWRDYADGPRQVAFLPYYGLLRPETREHLANTTQLMADLASGTLPPFAFIEPSYGGGGGTRTDEHPPGTPQNGQAWVEGIVRAVMASPAWRDTALILNYDEHGGFADHVPPPEACAPDAIEPALENPTDVRARFDRLGFRVPLIVVSPYARRHFVSHRVYDHTSVLRFVEARFGLPAMTRRDANATPLHDLFDFTSPPNLTVPTLRPTRVDAAVQARCATQFPRGDAF